MNHFHYRQGRLHVEEVPLARLAAEIGTPTYVYSQATLTRRFQAFSQALAGRPHLICFSMKANASLAILKLFADLGGGVDVVSGGELFAALAAGVPAEKICFSGVGKTEAELVQALEAGILMFNVESLAELEALEKAAQRLGRKARLAVRVNPDVDPKTHPYISTGLKKNKFGLDVETALAAYRRAKESTWLTPVGLDCHIGSQLTELTPFLETVRRLKALAGRLKAEGVELEYLDLGGGLGITYNDETPPSPAEYVAGVVKELDGWNPTLIFEPGRALVGDAGVLLTRVIYLKPTEVKKFVVVDASMTELIRPGLYEAYHHILPVQESGPEKEKVDVVGSVCESTDWLAKDRPFPAVSPGDLLAIMSAGAYGMSMSSTYNLRPRPAEVLVHGDKWAVVRNRERFEDFLRGQVIPEFV